MNSPGYVIFALRSIMMAAGKQGERPVKCYTYPLFQSVISQGTMTDSMTKSISGHKPQLKS